MRWSPDAGTIEIGQTVKIGYFSQESESLDDNMRVIDYIKEAGEYVQTIEGTITAAQMLERFLLTGPCSGASSESSPVERNDDCIFCGS